MFNKVQLEGYVKELINYQKMFFDTYQSCNLCFDEDYNVTDFHPKSYQIKEVSLFGYIEMTNDTYELHLCEKFYRYREVSIQESPDDILEGFLKHQLGFTKVLPFINDMDIYIYALDGDVYRYEFGELVPVDSKESLNPDFYAVSTIRKELKDNQLFLPLSELEDWLSKDHTVVEDLVYRQELNNSEQMDLFDVFNI